MSKIHPRHDRFRPYLIAAAVLGAVAFVAGFVWIAALPETQLNHIDKSLALFLLVALPGRYALQRMSQQMKLQKALQERISNIACIGLMCALFEATQATGYFDAIWRYVTFFVVGGLAVFILNVKLDKLAALWKAYRSKAS